MKKAILFFFVFLSLVYLVSAQGNFGYPEGLNSYYKFNGNGVNAIKDEVNFTQGIGLFFSTNLTGCKLGECLRSNFTSYKTSSTAFKDSMNSNFTIEIAINHAFNSTFSVNSIQHFLHYYDGSKGIRGYVAQNKSLAFAFNTATRFFTYSNNQNGSSHWFVIRRWGNDTIDILVDNIHQFSTSQTGNMTPTNDLLAIFGDNVNPSAENMTVNSTADELRIWKSSRSNNELSYFLDKEIFGIVLNNASMNITNRSLETSETFNSSVEIVNISIIDKINLTAELYVNGILNQTSNLNNNYVHNSTASNVWSGTNILNKDKIYVRFSVASLNGVSTFETLNSTEVTIPHLYISSISDGASNYENGTINGRGANTTFVLNVNQTIIGTSNDVANCTLFRNQENLITNSSSQTIFKNVTYVTTNNFLGTYEFQFTCRYTDNVELNSSKFTLTFDFQAGGGDSGAGAGAGAGGAGGDATQPKVCLTSEKKWSLFTGEKKKSLEIIMFNSPRRKNLILTNNGTENVKVSLKCVEFNNTNFCKNVQLSNSSITVLPKKDETFVSMVIDDNNTKSDEIYDFSIIATDLLGCKDSIINKVEISFAGLIFKLGDPIYDNFPIPIWFVLVVVVGLTLLILPLTLSRYVFKDSNLKEMWVISITTVTIVIELLIIFNFT